jgi:hypothetical protein
MFETNTADLKRWNTYPWIDLFEIDLNSSSEKEYHYEKEAPVA